MKLVFSVQKPVILTISVLVAKFAHEVNVEQNVIQVLAHLVSCVKTVPALPAVVQIWIALVIDLASMANVWILVFVIMHAERTLCAKCLNIEQFVYVLMDSKGNRSKDAHPTNVKLMMTVNMINNVTVDHVKILAYKAELVVLMLNVAL